MNQTNDGIEQDLRASNKDPWKVPMLLGNELHPSPCMLTAVRGGWFTVILEHARDRIKKTGIIGVCITTLEFYASAEHFVGGQHCGQLQSKKCCIKMHQVSNIQ